MSDRWFAVLVLLQQKEVRETDRAQESQFGEWGECHDKTQWLGIRMIGKPIHLNGTWWSS